MSKQIEAQRFNVAAKAGVRPDQVVGPFLSRNPPVGARPGLYIRISTKTGEACWAHWNGQKFGLWADSKKRAMARKGKFSKKPASWYGFAVAPSAPAKRTR